MDTQIEFFNNKLCPKAKNKNSKNENNRCTTLSYAGNASLVFKKAFITQFKRINYHCNVNFGSFKVSNYFSLKDVTPLTHNANVVYCLKGSCDKTQSYIGKIKRHLAVREHLSGISGKSAIHEHISSCKDCHSCSIISQAPKKILS